MIYTICFCDSEHHLLKPVLKAGFSHCFAIKHTDDNYIVVNCERSHAEVDALPVTPFVYADLVDGMTRITLATKINEDKSIAGLRWLSCVESVKSLLGINDALLLTPYQLYKRLLRCQAKAVQSEQQNSNGPQ